MLDLREKYYVSAGAHLKSVIENWANENTMKLVGEDVALPTCGRVYELDVQHNADLVVKMKLLGSGRMYFMNGERTIGTVKYDRGMDNVKTVIYPMIRDR